MSGHELAAARSVRVIRRLIVSAVLALTAVLLAGCALVGTCCAPLAIGAAASKAHSDSTVGRRDTSAASFNLASHTRTLAVLVNGLPRRGDFL